MSVSSLLQYYDTSDVNKDDIKPILLDTNNGFAWANADLKYRQREPLYCPPGKLALTGEQLIDTLRRKLRNDPAFGAEVLGLGLLMALQDTFPCE
jgi:hypothetical protein